jgi:hypothetical protein
MRHAQSSHVQHPAPVEGEAAYSSVQAVPVASCNSCQFHIGSRCRYHHKGTLPEVDLQSQEAAHLLNEHHSPSRFCSRLAQNDKIISIQQQQ